MRHYATPRSSSSEHNFPTNTPVSYGYNAPLLLAGSAISLLYVS